MDTLLALAANPEAWAALATLIVMEVVLGIDNLIFISILTNKLPEGQRSTGRRIGIGLSLILRLGLLGTDRKSTRLNSKSLMRISYAVFCLQKKNHQHDNDHNIYHRPAKQASQILSAESTDVHTYRQP